MSLPLLRIKPWILFFFLQEFFPFVEPFKHFQMVSKSRARPWILSPLTFLYSAAIPWGKMLVPNSPPPSPLCTHSARDHSPPQTDEYGPEWCRIALHLPYTMEMQGDNPKQCFLVLKTLYSPSKTGTLIDLAALTLFSLGKKSCTTSSTFRTF